jgi:hypothetical protein
MTDEKAPTWQQTNRNISICDIPATTGAKTILFSSPKPHFLLSYIPPAVLPHPGL